MTKENELREVCQLVLEQLRTEMPSDTDRQQAFHIGAQEAVNCMRRMLFARSERG